MTACREDLARYVPTWYCILGSPCAQRTQSRSALHFGTGSLEPGVWEMNIKIGWPTSHEPRARMYAQRDRGTYGRVHVHMLDNPIAAATSTAACSSQAAPGPMCDCTRVQSSK